MNKEIDQTMLNESLRRCLQNDKFLSIFYEFFLNTSDEIREKFKETSLDHQIDMMQKSLDAIISVSEANWSSDQFLSQVAKKHKNLNIKPDHYKFWEISLLATVAECDPEYNEQVRLAWKHVLDRGIQFMVNY